MEQKDLIRSLDHCANKLLEIRRIADEIEPGQIRTILLAAANRLEREQEELRVMLGVDDEEGTH